jgi:hypothetical protein
VISAEDVFILEFSKAYFGNCDPGRLSRRLDSCDPKLLSEKLARQGLTAFFFNAVHSNRVKLRLPADIIKNWKAQAAGIALRNAFYEDRGSRLLACLQEEGFGFIMLKGFAHMAGLYGNTWTRPVSDLDILIDREDYPRLKELLVKLDFSYRPGANFRGTAVEAQEIDETYYNEAHFHQGKGEVTFNFDVHWSIEGLGEDSPLKSLFPVEHYPWRRHTEVQLFGAIEVGCLTAEMQFIHNIMHLGLHHRLRGFKWFLDICLLLAEQGEELDWDFIRKTVREPDCRKLVGVVMRLAVEVTGPCPGVPHWREFWPGVGLPGEYGYYRHRIFSGGGRAGDYVTLVLLPLRLRDKFKVISYYLFRKEAVRHWRAGGRKGLHPVLQPFYIVCRVVGEVFHRPGQGGKK